MVIQERFELSNRRFKPFFHFNLYIYKVKWSLSELFSQSNPAKQWA